MLNAAALAWCRDLSFASTAYSLVACLLGKSVSLQTARADMLVFCCSNTGLGLDPGSLSQSVPSLRPSPSTGLASSQLQAWQFLLRRLPTAQRRLSTSASHCPVSLLTCHAADSDAVLCCAVLPPVLCGSAKFMLSRSGRMSFYKMLGMQKQVMQQQ